MTLSTLLSNNPASLALNLLSTFLYMTNYYIVGPSSAKYMTALSAPPSLAGLVLGFTSWGAMLSAVGYSYWTNSNYKRPLLASATSAREERPAKLALRV